MLVVTQKVVSKAEGRLLELSAVEPSDLARRFAAQWGKDARLVEVGVAREPPRRPHGQGRPHRRDEARLRVRQRRRRRLEHRPARPRDAAAGRPRRVPPSRSARRSSERAGVDVAVIISDSFGRPWRAGIDQVALGVAGLLPLSDYAGQRDPDGYELRVTQVAVADEMAAAAELVTGKLERIPVAIVRGYVAPWGRGSGRQLLREPEKDLFR